MLFVLEALEPLAHGDRHVEVGVDVADVLGEGRGICFYLAREPFPLRRNPFRHLIPAHRLEHVLRHDVGHEVLGEAGQVHGRRTTGLDCYGFRSGGFHSRQQLAALPGLSIFAGDGSILQQFHGGIEHVVGDSPTYPKHVLYQRG